METEKFEATVEVDLINNEATDTNPEFPGEATEKYLEKIETDYDEYAIECEAAMQKALLGINNLSSAFDRAGKRNPFDRIEYRIKTFKSVRGKCRARGYDLTTACIQEKVKDVAGIRIITKYIDEVNLIKDLITQSQEIQVVSAKDYIDAPKPNGYKSVHLSCQVGVYDPFQGLRMRPVEIQIRTKTMNLWATLDHDINYKSMEHYPEVIKRFQHIASILDQLEDEFKELRDYTESVKRDSPEIK